MKIFRLPSSAARVGDFAEELDMLQSFPGPLAQWKRRMLARHIDGKMTSTSKRNNDHKEPRFVREDAVGFYGGHNPSGRIRILKF